MHKFKTPERLFIQVLQRVLGKILIIDRFNGFNLAVLHCASKNSSP